MKIIDELNYELYVDTTEETKNEIQLLGDCVKTLKKDINDFYSTKTKLFKGLYGKIIAMSALQTAIIIAAIAAYVILH